MPELEPAPIREDIARNVNDAYYLSPAWFRWFSFLYDWTKSPTFSNLPTYADNATATAAGLAKGKIYKTATGQVMVVY